MNKYVCICRVYVSYIVYVGTNWIAVFQLQSSFKRETYPYLFRLSCKEDFVLENKYRHSA